MCVIYEDNRKVLVGSLDTTQAASECMNILDRITRQNFNAYQSHTLGYNFEGKPCFANDLLKLFVPSSRPRGMQALINIVRHVFTQSSPPINPSASQHKFNPTDKNGLKVLAMGLVTQKLHATSCESEA